jgi:hypothetical protein
MTDPNDGLRVTNRDLWLELKDFRSSFMSYINEQAPRMALLELKVQQNHDRIEDLENDLDASKLREEDVERDMQNRKVTTRWIMISAFITSSVASTLIQYLLLHK